MYRGSYQQFAIVTSDSAQELTDQLNAKLRELKGYFPKVEFEGMIARISYTAGFEVAENVADEYELAGVNLTCQDCPYFQRIMKADGTADSRAKWGDCVFAQYGRASRDSRACSVLFDKINSGEVRLCLAEEEK